MSSSQTWLIGLTGLLFAGCTAMHRPPTSSAPASRPSAPVFDLQGHRGARGLLPENTVPAFLHALELGVRTLEMDAVISRDQEVVLSHEPWFSGVICSLPSGAPVPEAEERTHRLYDLTYEEIKAYDCGLRPHPGFPRQARQAAVKPLLRDVVAAAERYAATHGLPPVQYNIETKSTPAGDGVLHPEPETFVRLLYEVLQEAGIRDRAIVQSFDVRTLQAARRLDPGLRLALLVSAGQDRGLEANLAALGFTPAIYSPDHQLVDAALVAAAHARGMQVIPWTVNTLGEMQALRRLGVDGLITDYPDIGRRLLE